MIDDKFPNDPKGDPSKHYTCPSECVERNHPGMEHEQWVAQTRQPSQEVLALIALVMRQNDYLLGILQNLDDLLTIERGKFGAEDASDRAGEIYDAHEAGASFQPKLFIPVFKEEPTEPVEEEKGHW